MRLLMMTKFYLLSKEAQATRPYITAADASHRINAGDNVSWNGNSWDNLAGIVDLSAYAKSSDVANTYMKKSDYPMATDADILALFT